MVWLPTERDDVLKVAGTQRVPQVPERVPVPIVVAPSLKVMVPVALPVPPFHETCAVKVTDWPKTEGFVPEATEVVVDVSAEAISVL